MRVDWGFLECESPAAPGWLRRSGEPRCETARTTSARTRSRNSRLGPYLSGWRSLAGCLWRSGVDLRVAENIRRHRAFGNDQELIFLGGALDAVE